MSIDVASLITQQGPQLQILICPWELRGLLAELGNEHEQVELVRTVEPGNERNDAFWSWRPFQGIVLWIRINGRFCPRVVEGQILQHEYITEYFARREHVLRLERERKA